MVPFFRCSGRRCRPWAVRCTQPKLTFAWDWSNYAGIFAVSRPDHPVAALRADRDGGLACCCPSPGLRDRVQTGRYKNLLLGLVVLPFFVTFLVRTLAWKTIFADGGFLVRLLDTLGLLVDGRLLSTSGRSSAAW